MMSKSDKAMYWDEEEDTGEWAVNYRVESLSNPPEEMPISPDKDPLLMAVCIGLDTVFKAVVKVGETACEVLNNKETMNSVTSNKTLNTSIAKIVLFKLLGL